MIGDREDFVDQKGERGMESEWSAMMCAEMGWMVMLRCKWFSKTG